MGHGSVSFSKKKAPGANGVLAALGSFIFTPQPDPPGV
jgi:hypothetical protein